jgi:hypothetical protein
MFIQPTSVKEQGVEVVDPTNGKVSTYKGFDGVWAETIWRLAIRPNKVKYVHFITFMVFNFIFSKGIRRRR